MNIRHVRYHNNILICSFLPVVWSDHVSSGRLPEVKNSNKFKPLAPRVVAVAHACQNFPSQITLIRISLPWQLWATVDLNPRPLWSFITQFVKRKCLQLILELFVFFLVQVLHYRIWRRDTHWFKKLRSFSSHVAVWVYNWSLQTVQKRVSPFLESGRYG